MASNLVNVNLCYIDIELCIAQLGTQVRRLGTQVRGNILAVSISGAALPYSAVWLWYCTPSGLLCNLAVCSSVGRDSHTPCIFAEIPLHQTEYFLTSYISSNKSLKFGFATLIFIIFESWPPSWQYISNSSCYTEHNWSVYCNACWSMATLGHRRI